MGTLLMLLLAGTVVFCLMGGFTAASIFSSALLLYWVWRTYDTFVLQECWTVFLEEVK